MSSEFNDVESGMINCITDDNANKIASFVNERAINKDMLVVQCGYGVSRSLAVAAAVMKAVTDNDASI
jgi:predicted protein tyrosine phosphatase